VEDVCVFCGHLVYFKAIWYILRPFGIFYGHLVYVFCVNLVYFPHFGRLHNVKSGNPANFNFPPSGMHDANVSL
jgi:hypothetical protein